MRSAMFDRLGPQTAFQHSCLHQMLTACRGTVPCGVDDAAKQLSDTQPSDTAIGSSQGQIRCYLHTEPDKHERQKCDACVGPVMPEAALHETTYLNVSLARLKS